MREDTATLLLIEKLQQHCLTSFAVLKITEIYIFTPRLHPEPFNFDPSLYTKHD